MLKAGATFFYPAHGVARVVGVEEREFGDVKQEFYVLELSRGGVSLVPVNNVEHAELRPLISANKARILIKRMRDEPRVDNSKSWKERAARYSEGLKTGSPDVYSQILQELLYRAKADKLSTTETKMLETARTFFISEVGEVLDMAVEKIDKQLADAMTFLLPDIEDPSLDDDDEEEEGGGEGGGEGEGEGGGEGDGEGDAGGKKTATKAAKKKTGKKTGKKAAKKKTAKKTAKKKASKAGKKKR